MRFTIILLKTTSIREIKLENYSDRNVSMNSVAIHMLMVYIFRTPKP